MKFHFLIQAFIILGASLWQSILADDTRITLGIGYDQIAQGYYLNEIDTLAVDEDSLFKLRRTTDEISTPRLKSRVVWNRDMAKGTTLEFDNLTLISDEDIRNNIRGTFETGHLELSNEFEFRGLWEEDDSDRVGYLTNEIRAGFKPPLGRGFYMIADESFEILRFDGEGLYTFDYNYNRLKIGIEKQFGWVDYILLAYRNDIRNVPDSSRINYARHRAIMELYWSPVSSITLDIENEISRTESNKESNLDDRIQEFLDAEFIFRLTERFSLDVKNLFEYTDYDTQDVVNFNSIYNVGSLEGSYEFIDGLEFNAGPSYTIFWSESVIFEEQDYEQFALEYGFDISLGDRLWCDISHTYGKRDYTHENSEFYTDYTLNELDILGDIKIYKNLRLNLILSIDWENHTIKDDDNRLSLLNIGLDYHFR